MDIFSIIEERRKRALSSAEAAYNAARLSPSFCAADSEVTELDMSIAWAKVHGESTAALQKKYDKAVVRRALALKKLSLSEKDLLPSYTCTRCNDTGYYQDVPCVCVKQLQDAQRKKDCGITGMPASTFDSFEPKRFPVEIQTLYNKLKQYCDKFDTSRIITHLIIGGTGAGKTYAAAAVANELSKKGVNVLYFTAFAFNRRMLSAHTDFSEQGRAALDEVLSCDLLIIDDLGTEPIYKNVTIEYLLNVLNERLVSGKHTLINTNLSLEDLTARYGSRVSSRLAHPCAAKLVLSTPDLRILK